MWELFNRFKEDISTHTLRKEGDADTWHTDSHGEKISTHTLRKEGDRNNNTTR